MNQKKFFQFSTRPTEKELAFREELPEGHPFTDEVQFARAENVDLRRKFAATAQALGFDIETGKRVVTPGRPALNVAPDVPRYDGHERLEVRHGIVGQDDVQSFDAGSEREPKRTPADALKGMPDPFSPKTKWTSAPTQKQAKPVVPVRGTPQSDQNAIEAIRELGPIARGDLKEYFYVDMGNGFVQVPSETRLVRRKDGSVVARTKPDWGSIDAERVVAILHTHPRQRLSEDGTTEISRTQDQWNIAPGPDDYLAVVQGLPNYIEQDGRLGVLEYVDAQWQFRMIKGNVFDDRAQRIEKFKDWNEDKEIYTEEGDHIQRQLNQLHSDKRKPKR